MASNINIGNNVFVCASRFRGTPDHGKAFYFTEVLDRRDRSISIKLPDGSGSEFVSSKFAHHGVGLAIICVGDFLSEATLLDPLSKSILQNNRLLFGDDSFVKYVKVRSKAELEHLFRSRDLNAYSNLIFIGHGSKAGELCGGVDAISADDFTEMLAYDADKTWTIAFLCCYLGKAGFAKSVSKSRYCLNLIAPRTDVHAAVSSQFIQTYLVRSLLDGETAKVAFKNSKSSLPQASTFRMWQNGKICGNS